MGKAKKKTRSIESVPAAKVPSRRRRSSPRPSRPPAELPEPVATFEI